MTDKIGMEAMADVVYIDAATGDPLLLIKNISTIDPSFTCWQINDLPQNSNYRKRLIQSVLYLVGILITAVYGVAVLIMGSRLYRRKTAALNTPVS